MALRSASNSFEPNQQQPSVAERSIMSGLFKVVNPARPVVGAGDGGASGDDDDVDEGRGDFAPTGVGQASKVLGDARGEVAGHER
jgi:hypothetical protein